ncbi:MAG TPA: glycosyltransferase [Arachidicoccus sp.]
MNKKENRLILLFSALDWGLGHTTRSIPLLRNFVVQGYEIFIACEQNSASEKILKHEFAQANFLALKGYHIAYAKKSKLFVWKIVQQIPKIIAAIKNERQQVAKWCEQYHFDLIVSDNRYGFFNEKIKSVFITHQLQIAAPSSFLEKIIQRLNYHYINRFSECWIPDFEGDNNIAGRLSHPKNMPDIAVKYIGALSRLKKISAEKKYDVLILLSGPEPQRTVLENRFLQIKNQFKEKVLLVRGLPNDESNIASTENFSIKNYYDADALSEAIAQSEWVVCRSGYSTVMDLFYLEKKAIFIPTPGQTEQQYLAEILMGKGFSYAFEQNDKDYYAKIQHAKNFGYKKFNAIIELETITG